jgi:hypothetical protein
MTMQLPAPIPLEMPAGDADEIAALARDVAAAARCLAAVDVRISGAAAGAPGWLGDDASAAAAQVLEVDVLIRGAYDAVVPAAQRLAAHADRLLETRSRVRALRHEQDEQFAAASRQWVQVESLQLQIMTGGPGVRAIVDEVQAGEASRRGRHAALLEEIEDDAAATARVLVDSCAAVGGHGRRAEANVVVAHLAAQLPGWGDRELIRRGLALAARLTDGTPDTMEEAASAAAAFAGSAVFANALLGALGQKGVAYALTNLGRDMFG